jgi:hypothetical protein
MPAALTEQQSVLLGGPFVTGLMIVPAGHKLYVWLPGIVMFVSAQVFCKCEQHHTRDL